jgi:CDP-paratose 2-epimerase
MKLLVFGGIGFIGTNICKLAIEHHHEVIAFDNLNRAGVKDNLNVLAKSKQFSFIHADIRRRSDFKNIPGNIDRIINLAANPSVPKSIKHPRTDFLINVAGHLNILDFARAHGNIPVIFASSNKVFTDKLNTFPFTETTTRYTARTKTGKPLFFNEATDVNGYEGFTNSPYGTSKLAAEKYTREYWKHYDLPIVINRMSCIYGLYQKGVEEQGWVDWFIRAKKFHYPLTIYGNGKQVRDLLFGTDVARLFLFEAEHIHLVNGQTFNVGGGSKPGFNTSLLEFIHLVDEEFPGPKLEYTLKPWRKSDHLYYISDLSRVYSFTKWQPSTPIRQGIRKMWQAYLRET